MNFKEKLLQHKKMLIGAVAAVVLGTTIGFANMIPMEEHNKLIAKKTEVTTQVENTNKEISKNSEKLAKVSAEKATLQAKLDSIEVEKARVEAEKKETERLAADARLAKIEADKKAKEQAQANQGSNSGSSNSGSGSSSNGNSSSGSSSGSGNVSTPKPDTSTPVGATVWRTTHGKKYHKHNNCGNSQTAVQVSLDTAKNSGLTACKTCY